MGAAVDGIDKEGNRGGGFAQTRFRGFHDPAQDGAFARAIALEGARSIVEGTFEELRQFGLGFGIGGGLEHTRREEKRFRNDGSAVAQLARAGGEFVQQRAVDGDAARCAGAGFEPDDDGGLAALDGRRHTAAR